MCMWLNLCASAALNLQTDSDCCCTNHKLIKKHTSELNWLKHCTECFNSCVRYYMLSFVTQVSNAAVEHGKKYRTAWCQHVLVCSYSISIWANGKLNVPGKFVLQHKPECNVALQPTCYSIHATAKNDIWYICREWHGKIIVAHQHHLHNFTLSISLSPQKVSHLHHIPTIHVIIIQCWKTDCIGLLTVCYDQRLKLELGIFFL